MRKSAAGGRLLLFVAVLMWLGSASVGGQSARQSETAKRFIGTWKLVSIVEPESEGARGPHPTGLIIYDATGHMAVQIMPDRVRPKYAGTLPTPNEARAAVLGYAAYFGTYTVDERARTVTHHREGNINPGELGDFVRRYEFLPGNRIVLRPLENQNALTWERIK
jgi:hypothetical protein